ncbi:MAG: VanZ family protein [Candidatus Rokubacteria bacterium]|nr:VanZ family protein [Candidatus Rokubacteria bacterium]
MRPRRRYGIAVAVYVTGLAALVLWPLTAKDSGAMWDLSAWLGYDYTPAREIAADVTINVLAFVPVGFLLQRIVRGGGPASRGGALVALAAGASVAVIFETVQWMFAWRIASVTDVAANTAGTAVGLALERLLGRA